MKRTNNDRYRRALHALLERMRPDADSINEQTRVSASGEGNQELSNAPFHLGDRGTDEFLFDMNAVLLENEEYLVNEVRAALTRVDHGSFGVCEQCGNLLHAVSGEEMQQINVVDTVKDQFSASAHRGA